MASGERSAIDPAAVRAALDRLVASKNFVRSKNLRRFLEFTVSQTLSGAVDAIKESTIAVEAYGRKASYDPRQDPIVRTDAVRLRKKLEAYYGDEGASDAVRIHYPKGSYVPVFAPAVENAAAVETRKSATASTWLPAAATLAVGGAVALAVLLPRDDAPAHPPRIAVLRFDDFSQGSDQAALALATTEALTARLSRERGLEVVSRGTATRLEETPSTTKDTASRLNVDYVVEGSVQRVGESCRITAQLARAEDEVTIWAEQYSIDWPRVLEVQEEIADDIAAEIGARVGRLERRQAIRAATKDPEAFEALARARYAMVRFSLTDSPGYVEQAKRELSRALALDPDYTDALAEKAYFNLQRIYPPRPGAQPIIAESRNLLARALHIDPEHVQGLYLMGQVESMLGNRREGLRLTFRALDLDPGNPDVHAALATRYTELGFWEAAEAEARRAIELDTEWLLPYRFRMHLLARMGRIEQAREALRELEARTGQVPSSARLAATVELHASRPDAARAMLAGSIDPSQASSEAVPQEVLRGLASALEGDVVEGRRALEKYAELHAFWDDLTNLALVLGEIEIAIEQIENTPAAFNYRWLATNAHVRPYLRRPELAKLLDRLHADWESSLELASGRLPELPPALPAPEELMRAIP